jgi:fatty acid desaturase
MKKTIFISISNTILFLLFGLTLLFPFSEIHQIGTAGFSGTITIYPMLLAIYLIIYPVVYFTIGKKLKWSIKDNSELKFSDEREKVIVSEAAKTSYKILVGGLIAIIAIIGGVKFFSLFTHETISIYFVSVLLITILLVLSTVIYCIKWCLEYRK